MVLVFNRAKTGFTLVEIMVTVAIAGLVLTGGLNLVGVALRALVDVRLEQELVSEAQKVYLEYLTREDMPDRGERDGVRWRAETDTISAFGNYELGFRRLIVEYQDREMILYLPGR